MNVVIFACSLNPASRSALLAESVASSLRRDGASVEVVDLREVALPLCDGGAAYGAEAVAGLSARIVEADAVLVAAPIYNYDVNAATKNLIELTGRSWTARWWVFFVRRAGRVVICR